MQPPRNCPDIEMEPKSQPQTGQQPEKAAGVKVQQTNGAIAVQFRQQDGSNQEAAEREKNIDARAAAANVRNPGVGEEHDGHGDRSDSIQTAIVGHCFLLRAYGGS